MNDGTRPWLPVDTLETRAITTSGEIVGEASGEYHATVIGHYGDRAAEADDMIVIRTGAGRTADTELARFVLASMKDLPVVSEAGAGEARVTPAQLVTMYRPGETFWLKRFLWRIAKAKGHRLVLEPVIRSGRLIRSK